MLRRPRPCAGISTNFVAGRSRTKTINDESEAGKRERVNGQAGRRRDAGRVEEWDA